MLLALLTLAPACFLAPYDLRVENLKSPLGVDIPQPRFSWKLKATGAGRDLRQSAYQIRVSPSPDLKKPIWTSPLQKSSETYGIPYKGSPLGSNRALYWSVRTADQRGVLGEWSAPAMFSTGLKKSDWRAEWISYDDANFARPASRFSRAHWIWNHASALTSAPAESHTFSRTVVLDQPSPSATISLTADDQFELLVNGQKVAESPGNTDAWRTYREVAIGSHLRVGTNVIEVRARNAGASPAGMIAVIRYASSAGGQEIVSDPTWQVGGKNAVALASYGLGPWGSFEAVKPPPAYAYRQVWNSNKAIRRATLFGTALGLVDFRINGKEASEDLFTPGWSDYDKRVYYKAYDVTKSVAKGENLIEAIVGDGWYSGYVGYGGRRAHYGPKPMFKAQLILEYQDGSSHTVATDGTWQVTASNIVENDFLIGETHDARLSLTFDRHAKVERQNRNLEWFPGDPVRRYASLRPTTIKSLGDDRYLLDFGQNLAGFLRLKLQDPGQRKIVMRFAEVLDKDGELYTANLRGATSIDTYYSRGRKQETWQPRFTFHGFRYAEVSGLGRAPSADEVSAIAISSATPETGTLETSDPMLNKIVKNAWWTQKMNFIDIPTDCPQRDERLGWTGDAQAYIRTASMYSDVQAFFTKWLVALDDSQRADGQFPMVAPLKVAEGDGGPAWADAGVICPWTIYDVYGDRRQLAQHYPNMKRFIDFMVKRSKPNLLPPEQYHCFGDWLQIGANTPPDVIYMSYFAGSARLVAESAKVLGHPEDAKKYEAIYQRVKKSFNDAYVTSDGVVAGDTQCAYVLALNFDLLDAPRAKMASNRLVADIEKRGWHLSTGFVGTRDLMHVLTKIGRNDVAFRLLHNKTFPSWGFEVVNGATTIWERWDGWTPEKGFQDAGMNSFSHYAYGAVVGWMFKEIGGIDNKTAGFTEIRIAPAIDPKLTWARTTYKSVQGPIVCNWKKSGAQLTLDVTIPPNTKAEIQVPQANGSVRTENRGSGSYTFASNGW